MRILLPPLYGINERINQNPIRQIIQTGYYLDGNIENIIDFNLNRKIVFYPANSEFEPILILANGSKPKEGFSFVLRFNMRNNINDQNLVDLSTGTWVKHPSITEVPRINHSFQSYMDKIISSWRNSFIFKQENPILNEQGLRAPQIGAIHAILAHWSTTDIPATVIMPTGTGKTETMLSVLISQQCSKLLVVVPTDALRTQISEKFLTLGLLKKIGVLNQKTLLPIVGVLKHKPHDIDEIDSLFEKCNVIVTTMQIAGQCCEKFQERFAYQCQYLFIDEAHHIAARTWKGFKQIFKSRRILQFTATPFRNDGKQVDGKPIYNFPLRKAQEQGYFARISYQPVCSYDLSNNDRQIAERAVDQLREDLQKGYNHILMARVESVERAEEIFKIYEQYPEFNPVQIHCGIKSIRERDEIRRKIINKETRIVICVDMLGEGFDLPELKIAALHDIRKSLPITLQLIGRFIRGRQDLGSPTFIANVGDISVGGELRDLYAQDADWNLLLPDTSEKVTNEQIEIFDFNEGFMNFPNEIPINNIHPAMSTIVYKTTNDEWKPERCMDGIEGVDTLEWKRFSINKRENTLVLLTMKKVPVDWIQAKEIHTLDWELFIVIWDQNRKLLFINSSNNSGYYQRLAEAIAGDVELIRGRDVFRCLSGINRLKLQSVGLIEEYGRLIRYINPSCYLAIG